MSPTGGQRHLSMHLSASLVSITCQCHLSVCLECTTFHWPFKFRILLDLDLFFYYLKCLLEVIFFITLLMVSILDLSSSKLFSSVIGISWSFRWVMLGRVRRRSPTRASLKPRSSGWVSCSSLCHTWSWSHPQAIMGGVAGFWGGVFALGAIYLFAVFAKRMWVIFLCWCIFCCIAWYYTK